MLHARAGCKQFLTESLPCVSVRLSIGEKSHHGQVAGGEARLMQRHWSPSVTRFRQSLPAAWVVTHKTKASVCVSPQSVGMEHPGRSCLTIPPQPAHEHPTSYVDMSHPRTHATGL
jgi:hypothetical protein